MARHDLACLGLRDGDANALRRAGLNTVEEVAAHSNIEALPMIGKVRAARIRAAVSGLDLLGLPAEDVAALRRAGLYTVAQVAAADIWVVPRVGPKRHARIHAALEAALNDGLSVSRPPRGAASPE